MFDIIQIGGSSGEPLSLDAESRRVVRSNAMRHFRRKQKEARNSGCGQKRIVLPALVAAGAVDSGQAPRKLQAKDDNDSPPVPETGSGPCSNKACWDASAPLIPQPGGATFYRHILVELFGASLVGPGVRRTRSRTLIDYRIYVATTQSSMMQAVDDTVCLMLPGCTLDDSRILIESRKRHLAGIECMRQTLGEETYDVDSTIASAVELLFVEIFKPASVGTKNLYGGVVYLVRKGLPHLQSSQTPVTIFLLAQLRQIMLIESLASRTPLPIGTETWQHLTRISTLPQMTETLMQLAIQVPALLETAHQVRDSVLADPVASERTLSDLLALERSLVQWDIKHCAGSHNTAPRHHLPPLRGASSINMAEVVAQCDETLDEMHFLTAQCRAMCYICLLTLRESLASLFDAQGDEESRRYYTAEATQNADVLCQLADHFIWEEADSALSKALSVRAPLHFARQWYETSGNREGAACVSELEARVQKEVPFLSWQSLLPLSLVSIYMLG